VDWAGNVAPKRRDVLANGVAFVLPEAVAEVLTLVLAHARVALGFARIEAAAMDRLRSSPLTMRVCWSRARARAPAFGASVAARCKHGAEPGTAEQG
jgi:hypothetical protein